MRPFRYSSPKNLDDLLQLLDEHGPSARLLAGGTDVMVRLRLGHMKPEVVADLKRVSELRADVSEEGAFVRVGARAVMADIIADDRVRRWFPALVEAASVVGSVQIRNRATLAGNICNASPAADTAPPLLAYGAIVNLVSLAGRRAVLLGDFFAGPGKTVLKRNEMVESIDIPRPESPAGGAFGRVTRRRGVDLATINLCCVVTASGETRFAYGAVGPRPFLTVDESGALSRADGDPREKDEAFQRLIGQASPISDIRGSREYRLAMLSVMSRRALQTALERRAAGAA